jgi:TFIIB zinc-binding
MIMMIEKGDQDSVSRCSICNKANTTIMDPNSGEIICSNCGMVISEKIEDVIHPEQRMHSIRRFHINHSYCLPSHSIGYLTDFDKLTLSVYLVLVKYNN